MVTEKEKNPHTHSPTMECSLKEKEKKARTHSPKMECCEKEKETAASGNLAENPVKKPVRKETKPHTLSPPEKQVKKMESSLKEEEKPHTHSPPAASGKPVKKMESSLKEEEKPHTHSPPAATGKPVKKPPVKERLIGCFSDENFEIGEGIEKFMPSPGTGHTFVKKRASLSSSGCRKSLWDIVKGQLRDKRDKEQRCCVISTDQAKQAKEEKRPSTDWFSKYEKPATRDLNSKVKQTVQVKQTFLKVENADKMKQTLRFVEKGTSASTIVCCTFDGDVEKVRSFLSMNGVPALQVNRNLPKAQRENVEQSFIERRVKVLVVTSEILRRMSVDGFRLLNFDLPIHFSDYQRFVAMAAEVVTFINKSSAGLSLQKLVKELGEEGIDLPNFLKKIAES